LDGEFFDGEGEDFIDDGAKVVFAELKLNRAAEVDEQLDDPIKAVNLGFNDLEMPGGRSAGAGGGELALEQFDVHDDGVDGVFDLVAYSGREPADGGHAAGDLKLGLDGFDGFKIVEGKKSTQSVG